MVNKTQTLVKRNSAHGGDHVGARISRQEVEKLDALVDAGAFLNRSDAVRTAIRNMVSEVRMMKVRQISIQEAKEEIRKYLKEREQAYPSDMADALELDYDLVVKALRELRKSGEVEPA